MRTWKRLLLIAASIGAGLAIVAALLGLGTYWYYSHPRPTREWSERDIEAYGVKASLKTRWRDDALSYRLEVLPLNPDAIDAFDRSFRPLPEKLGFKLFLYDNSGFQLCSASIEKSDLAHDVDGHGKVVGLSVNATWPFCSYEHYKDASKWNLSWTGLSKLLPNPIGTAPSDTTVRMPDGTLVQNVPRGTPKSEALRRYNLLKQRQASVPSVATDETPGEQLGAIEGSDTLSGVDPVDNRLDMVSGRTFSVYRSGERYTVMYWSAKQRLRFSCKPQSDCVVVNTDRGETVHARLSK